MPWPQAWNEWQELLRRLEVRLCSLLLLQSVMLSLQRPLASLSLLLNCSFAKLHECCQCCKCLSDGFLAINQWHRCHHLSMVAMLQIHSSMISYASGSNFMRYTIYMTNAWELTDCPPIEPWGATIVTTWPCTISASTARVLPSILSYPCRGLSAILSSTRRYERLEAAKTP